MVEERAPARELLGRSAGGGNGSGDAVGDDRLENPELAYLVGIYASAVVLVIYAEAVVGILEDGGGLFKVLDIPEVGIVGEVPGVGVVVAYVLAVVGTLDGEAFTRGGNDERFFLGREGIGEVTVVGNFVGGEVEVGAVKAYAVGLSGRGRRRRCVCGCLVVEVIDEAFKVHDVRLNGFVEGLGVAVVGQFEGIVVHVYALVYHYQAEGEVLQWVEVGDEAVGHGVGVAGLQLGDVAEGEDEDEVLGFIDELHLVGVVGVVVLAFVVSYVEFHRVGGLGAEADGNEKE